jgi:Tfp pilus assembly protein PilF
MRPSFVFCAVLSLLGLAGCARAPRRSEPPPPPLAVDDQAQKEAFQSGLDYFGREQYAEARDAWRKAARLGPDTALGRKAREHLTKVERMLASLREIDDDQTR